MKENADRNYLLQAAAWQETLLQAYRSLHVTIQSILLAVGIGLTVASLTVEKYPSNSVAIILVAVILTCVFSLHLFSTMKFSEVVSARGNDINWWHKQIIRYEYSYPSDSR